MLLLVVVDIFVRWLVLIVTRPVALERKVLLVLPGKYRGWAGSLDVPRPRLRATSPFFLLGQQCPSHASFPRGAKMAATAPAKCKRQREPLFFQNFCSSYLFLLPICYNKSPQNSATDSSILLMSWQFGQGSARTVLSLFHEASSAGAAPPRPGGSISRRLHP